MTGRQIARVREVEQRLTRVAIGAGGLLMIVTIVPIIAGWMVG